MMIGRRLLGVFLAMAPFAAIIAVGLRASSGAEAAILAAIGLSPLWAGMFLLAFVLLASRSYRMERKAVAEASKGGGGT